MSTSRRYVAALVSIAHLLISSMIVLPTSASAQVPDGEPPAIQFERIAEGVLGDRQVFSATVTDEVGIEVVTLHYRLGDSDPYDTIVMEPLLGTDIFTASVDTSDTQETVLQYYIEARDEAGNRSIQGFAFDPIERVLVERASSMANADLPDPEPTVRRMSTGKIVTLSVVGGVLALVALGALANSGGGGGSSGNPAADDPQIPLDIVVDSL